MREDQGSGLRVWSAEPAGDSGQGPKLSYSELLPGGVGKNRSQAGSGQQPEWGGAAEEQQVGVGRQETDEVWTGRKQRT